MNKFLKSFFFLVGISLFPMPVFSLNNYFGIDKVSFDDDDYLLNWSVKHPQNKAYYIEDFIPKGESLTRFENKFSIYYIETENFKNVIASKISELKENLDEKKISYYNKSQKSDSDVVVDYYTELFQSGSVILAQNSFFRYINCGDHVIVFEWERRTFKNFDKFKAKSQRKRLSYIDIINDYSTVISLK